VKALSGRIDRLLTAARKVSAAPDVPGWWAGVLAGDVLPMDPAAVETLPEATAAEMLSQLDLQPAALWEVFARLAPQAGGDWRSFAFRSTWAGYHNRTIDADWDSSRRQVALIASAGGIEPDYAEGLRVLLEVPRRRLRPVDAYGPGTDLGGALWTWPEGDELTAALRAHGLLN
jgi:hypothetical protein